jgi:hypothetical protein
MAIISSCGQKMSGLGSAAHFIWTRPIPIDSKQFAVFSAIWPEIRADIF